MKISVREKEYICPVCQRSYKTEEDAASCLEKHKKAFAEQSPHYEVGAHVLTHRFNDSDYGKEKTTIIKMCGSFVELKILVENEEEERYWVRVVEYQTVDLEYDPTKFRRFVQLA